MRSSSTKVWKYCGEVLKKFQNKHIEAKFWKKGLYVLSSTKIT